METCPGCDAHYLQNCSDDCPEITRGMESPGKVKTQSRARIRKAFLDWCEREYRSYHGLDSPPNGDALTNWIFGEMEYCDESFEAGYKTAMEKYAR